MIFESRDAARHPAASALPPGPISAFALDARLIEQRPDPQRRSVGAAEQAMDAMPRPALAGSLA